MPSHASSAAAPRVVALGEYATAQLDGGTRAVRGVARAFLASVGGR